jgi:hypothetical protein
MKNATLQTNNLDDFLRFLETNNLDDFPRFLETFLGLNSLIKKLKYSIPRRIVISKPKL